MYLPDTETKMGLEFEKRDEPSLGKKNRNEGKFIELARKRAFQKKRRTKKEYFTYAP